jgi:predicted HAD superfamily Cof-like phosphohydrolase
MSRDPGSVHAQVVAFHVANDQPILTKPQVPTDDRVRLRLTLIAEEFFEGLRACLPDAHLGLVEAEVQAEIRTMPIRVDLPGLADALADLDYVIEGTRLEFGIDGDPIAAEVHRSNMSKLGADGKPVRRADGKIMKGPNFTPPDIAGELRKQGWEG